MGITIELDDAGHIVAVDHDHALSKAEINRIIASQGPIPSDPKAAAIRRDDDAILAVALSGTGLKAEAIVSALSQAEAMSAPAPMRATTRQQTLVSAETMAQLKDEATAANALSRRAWDLMSRFPSRVATMLHSVASRQSNRAAFMYETASSGLSVRPMLPPAAEEAALLPSLPEAIAEFEADPEGFVSTMDAAVADARARMKPAA